MRQYKHSYNAMLKANHLCRDCKRQDGRTLNGFVLCWECQQRANEQQRKRRESIRIQRRDNAKALYQERKAKGVCPCCGKALDGSYQTCSHCRALRRKAKEKAETIRRVVEDVNYPRGDNGICWRCNREPVKTGKRLCERCYGVQLALLEKAWAANRERRAYVKHQQCRCGADGQDHQLHP